MFNAMLRRIASACGPVNRTLLWVAAACALAFATLTVAVVVSPGPLPLDRSLAQAVQSADSPVFDPFNNFVAWFNGTHAIIAGAVVVGAVFLVRRSATPFALFAVIYSVIYNVVVFAVRRPRPTGLPHVVSHLGAYSYPSGHVGFFIWVATLVYVLLHRRSPLWARVTLVLGVALVVAAALSRIDVGAHWPSDVLGGLLVGVGWMAFCLSFGGLVERASSGERRRRR